MHRMRTADMPSIDLILWDGTGCFLKKKNVFRLLVAGDVSHDDVLRTQAKATTDEGSAGNERQRVNVSVTHKMRALLTH